MRRLNVASAVISYFVLCEVVCNGAARTRTYYIAAVEREWDYAPTGYNKIKGIKLEDDR